MRKRVDIHVGIREYFVRVLGVMSPVFGGLSWLEIRVLASFMYLYYKNAVTNGSTEGLFGQYTRKAVRESLGLSVNSLNNILSKMGKLGLLDRNREGVIFELNEKLIELMPNSGSENLILYSFTIRDERD